jgi:hypothetical protein
MKIIIYQATRQVPFKEIFKPLGSYKRGIFSNAQDKLENFDEQQVKRRLPRVLTDEEDEIIFVPVEMKEVFFKVIEKKFKDTEWEPKEIIAKKPSKEEIGLPNEGELSQFYDEIEVIEVIRLTTENIEKLNQNFNKHNTQQVGDGQQHSHKTAKFGIIVVFLLICVVIWIIAGNYSLPNSSKKDSDKNDSNHSQILSSNQKINFADLSDCLDKKTSLCQKTRCIRKILEKTELIEPDFLVQLDDLKLSAIYNHEVDQAINAKDFKWAEKLLSEWERLLSNHSSQRNLLNNKREELQVAITMIYDKPSEQANAESMALEMTYPVRRNCALTKPRKTEINLNALFQQCENLFKREYYTRNEEDENGLTAFDCYNQIISLSSDQNEVQKRLKEKSKNRLEKMEADYINWAYRFLTRGEYDLQLSRGVKAKENLAKAAQFMTGLKKVNPHSPKLAELSAKLYSLKQRLPKRKH